MLENLNFTRRCQTDGILKYLVAYCSIPTIELKILFLLPEENFLFAALSLYLSTLYNPSLDKRTIYFHDATHYTFMFETNVKKCIARAFS